MPRPVRGDSGEQPPYAAVDHGQHLAQKAAFAEGSDCGVELAIRIHDASGVTTSRGLDSLLNQGPKMVGIGEGHVTYGEPDGLHLEQGAQVKDLVDVPDLGHV